MKRSDTIKELAAALAKAQATLKNPAFDAKNPHFKSNYASLASVRNTVVPAFAAVGLGVMQDLVTVEGGVKCVTLITHASGEWIETEGLTVPADKQNAHGFGSASTYAKRFALMAVAGVVGDDDDDGNAAVESAPKAAPKPVAKPVNWLAKIEGSKNLDELKELFADAWKNTEGETQAKCKATYEVMKQRLTDEAMEAM